MVLDPAGDKHLEQLAAKRLALEIETVARQLLGDRARALPHVTGGGVLERGAHNAEQVVAMMLVKLVVLYRDDRVHEVGGQLIVGDGLPILDVDLAEDFVVPIDNHAGRFHLLEMREIEAGGLLFERGRDREEGQQGGDHDDDPDDQWEEKPRTRVPGTVDAGKLRWREIINRHAARWAGAQTIWQSRAT